MEETIFTKIIRGDIPSHKVYEDEMTFAFLDIHPISEGHVLVVPKSQVEFIWDLPAREYASLMETVQKIGAHLREALQVPYVGVQVVGVDVPHAHVHLIPFTHADTMHASADMSLEPDHESLARLAEKIRV
jgi:histidine triad (HIT) family protein